MTENQEPLRILKGEILQGKKGTYQIIKPIGQGGFGDTFLAEDLNPAVEKRYCVVKQLRMDIDHPPEIIAGIKKAFEKEARTLQRLGDQSGNIPCLYDYFSLTVTDPQLHTSQEFNFLVQQYIEGEDLSKELKKQGLFSETKVLDLLKNILPVLEFIHKHNVIHRDIKPKNIIRSTEEENKFYLIDFGAVKQVIKGDIDTTEKSIVFLSKSYAPPEQIDSKPVNASSDLYALAAACVQLLTGESHRDSRVNQLWNWRKYPHISQHLGKILERMLQEETYYRYQSAREVIEALNKLDEKHYTDQKINPGDGEQTEVIDSPQRQFIKVIKVLLIAGIILFPTGFLAYRVIRERQVISDSQLTIVQSFKSFKDEEFGIEIKYPQNWQTEKQQYTPLTGGIIAKIFPNSSSSNLDVGLFIRVLDLQQPQNLSDYNQAAIQEIKKSVIAVQILQEQSKNLDNREGYQIVYTGQDPINSNLRFKVMEVWTISDSKVYILTYRAEEKHYDSFLKDIEQTMIRSFRFQPHVTL
ncbi:MAG: protein kinase domain-containing protein [Sphaerospermopsis kisseleviana]